MVAFVFIPYFVGGLKPAKNYSFGTPFVSISLVTAEYFYRAAGCDSMTIEIFNIADVGAIDAGDHVADGKSIKAFSIIIARVVITIIVVGGAIVHGKVMITILWLSY